MTRINVVDPKELTDQHLIAEYRELPRVFALARVDPKAPAEYTLGPGHVRFFFDKTGFLARRQAALIDECLARGFAISHLEPKKPIPGLDNDWEPGPRDVAINRARISERIAARPGFYRQRGRHVDEAPAHELAAMCRSEGRG